MPKVDVNKKRNDPNAQIDLQTFWSEVGDLNDQKVVNLSGDWGEDFGHVFARYQNLTEDIIVPLGRLEDGKYAVFNLSINHNVLAVGSALSGLGVFRRSTLAHLTRVHSPEHLQIVIIDPIRALGDFDDPSYLAVPRAVSKDQILASLRWVFEEFKNRYDFLDKHQGLIHLHNEKSDGGNKFPRILLLITELGEVNWQDNEVMAMLHRIMQMARGVEINTIICTQQVSEHTLPDLISRNAHTKLAFKLPYKEDSKRIIGKAGAEELLGQGDMIFTDEVDYWRIQGFHY